MKPVYMINGFLDSGKTSFLTFTLAQDYFKIKGTTLLILCEEGEEEYDAELLKRSKTIVETIEDEEDFTLDKLRELDKQWRPERIVIEYNGMWNNKEISLPNDWVVEQQISMIDANTFSMYYNNMRSMVADMVRKSELVVFNRCDELRDELGGYRRNIKSINPGADVVFEDSQGEIDEIFEEDLPYELNTDHIDLTDMSYGIWYLDMMDHLERYEGKTVSFLAMALLPPKLIKGYFVPGRMAMTCCADDMAFIGFPCKYDKINELKNKSWVTVKAKVTRGVFPEYQGEGPVLEAVEVKPAAKPKEEVISFT